MGDAPQPRRFCTPLVLSLALALMLVSGCRSDGAGESLAADAPAGDVDLLPAGRTAGAGPDLDPDREDDTSAGPVAEPEPDAGAEPASGPPDAPALSLVPRGIKTFRFTWEDVAGETGYRLLEDPDGASGYREIRTIAADAQSHDVVVFLPGRINARYILQACNGAGCSDSAPVNVSGTLVEAIGYFKASNTGEFDSFGSSVALSGDGRTMAVGAAFEESGATGVGGDQADDSALFGAGAVYVFTRDGRRWSQQAFIKASNTGVFDQFGFSVALAADGDTLAVGAPDEDSAATGIDGEQHDDSVTNSGAVYVFTRSGGTWSQQAYVKASNARRFAGFGWSVALSGEGHVLAVGAPLESSGATGVAGDQDDASALFSGAAYVFERREDVWSQQAYIKASNTRERDEFGTSVALSAEGRTLAVGAPLEDSGATGIDGDQTDASARDSGAVYIFARTEEGWRQQAYVKASNTQSENNYFGHGIALAADGDTLAVGAYWEDSGATGVDGNQADIAVPGSGAVYVFTRDQGAWSQQAYVKASNTSDGDGFGRRVALSADGDTLAVGAPEEDGGATGINGDQRDNSVRDAGAVYVFTREAGAWRQIGYVKASNTERGDQYHLFFESFGSSVALAGDGSVLAVGAPGEDSAATGIGGDQESNAALGSGALYLY